MISKFFENDISGYHSRTAIKASAVPIKSGWISALPLVLLVFSMPTQAAAPIAADDTYSVVNTNTLSDDLSSNDSDLDGPTDVYSKLTNPGNGIASVNSDGTFTYTPNIAYVGADSFTYQIDDGDGGVDSATVSITVLTSTDYMTVSSSVLVTPEDNSIPLGITVDPSLFDAGTLPDTLGTEPLFRDAAAGSTPVVGTIPAGTSSISITGYSTQFDATSYNDITNNDYQFISVSIDLSAGTSSGINSFQATNINAYLQGMDQYSWESVPLGQSVLDDPSKVIGPNFTHGVSNPLFSVVGNSLEITDTHTLQTAYLVEYLSADGDSTNFIGADNSVQLQTVVSSTLSIPAELEPATGRKGLIKLNANAAAPGPNAEQEAKGFNRIVIDMDSGLIAGTIASEIGETANRTVTYAFEGYPLIDLREVGAPVPLSVQSSTATIVGDFTADSSINDDPTIYIDATGDLVIERSSTFHNAFHSMYTAEFYERTGLSSIAKFLTVESDNTFFDANPGDGVDSNGKPIDEMLFPIPASAQMGVFQISWSVNGGNGTQENMGTGVAVIDLERSITSGSMIFIRVTSPDMLSWDAVPMGETMFGATDDFGDPLYISNRSAGGFIDPFPQYASFSIVNNADGSRSLRFIASSPVHAQDYLGNAQVSWSGSEAFEISGSPSLGTFSHGSPLPSGNWEIDFSDLSSVSFIPYEHVSGLESLAITLLSTGEVEAISVSIEPVTDAATLNAGDVAGNTNVPLPLAVAAVDSLDVDGSEALSDIELTAIPASVTLSASAGSVTDNGGGSWTISPAALPSLSATGTTGLVQLVGVSVTNVDTFDVDGDTVVEDGNNGAGVDERDELVLNKSFTLTITEVPVSTADSASVAPDTNASMSLVDNISDGDNDEDLSTIDLDQATSGNQNTLTTPDGIWSVNSVGVVTFDPNPAFEGSTSASFNVEDSAGNESNISTLTVLVAGAVPVSTPDSTTVTTDINATLDLSDNVTDANNDVDISSIDLDPTTPGNQNTLTTGDGVWSVDAVGVVRFDPDSDFEGTATIPYTVKDDDGNESLPADISVTVGGATPVATADSATVTTDSIATVDLSDNVTDANNDVDITTIDLDPSTPGNQNTLTTGDGVWSVDALGTVSFDPDSDFEGTATIPYTVKDDDGNESLPADISVTVGGATPVATADSATVTADSIATVDLSDNVTDANNDVDITTIDLDPSTPGNQNTLTTGDGVWSVDAVGVVSFDPDSDFEGTATISYTVEDDDGNESLAADISVTVGGATPVATADSATVTTDSIATVDLSDNVTDANNDVDITTIDLDPSTPGNQNSLTTGDGVWSVDALGIVSFNPDSDFEGTATIPFTVKDDDGNESLAASISVTVGGATPVATTDSATVTADGVASVDLSDNVTDANNDIDITTIDLDPSTPGNQNTLTTGDGVWSVDAVGVVSFDPDSDFEGTATIPYTVKDDDGNESLAADISVTVGGATPVATADSATVTANSIATVDLSDNVTDANNDVDITTIDLDPSTPGNQNALTTGDGVWSVDALGIVSFDPDSDFEGTATIPYTVEDDDGNESLATNISVTVGGATPVATVDSATVTADSIATVDLSDNVTDANNDVDITTIDLDPSTPGNQNTLTTGDGVWSVDALGTVSFDPDSDFEGIATIPYTVKDDDGNESLAADISITVGGATPVATTDSATVTADSIATVDLSDNVTDANNDVDITTIDLDPSTPGDQNTLTTGDGVWSVDALGTVSFDPDSDFEGTATIPYTVKDDDGNESLAADISVTVGGATPVATTDSATVTADSIASVDLSDNVTDANNDVDITTIDLDPSTPGNQNTLTTGDGVWTVDAVGVVSFDPNSDFEGTVTIPYTIKDDDGNESLAADITVTVGGATPVATTDSATVTADGIATVDLSDNVSDANNDIDITTIDLDPSTPGNQNTLTTGDGVWTVDAVGVVSFDPNSDFEGTATIPYTVKDDDGNESLAADISVTVDGATPVATADNATVTADSLATVDLSNNVTDANNDIDITTIDLDPSTPGDQNIVTTADGVWTVDALGIVSFDPHPYFEGTATIPYTVKDDDGNESLPESISVTVGGATPIATTDSATVTADSIATVDLSDNVTDANNDVDLTTIDLDPSTPGNQNTITTTEGVWTVDVLGTVSFDPDPDFEGTATIPYTIKDDDGNESSPTDISVTVAGATPIATADSATVIADGMATVDLSDNVTDANNDVDITTIDLDPSTPGNQNTLTTGDGVWSVDTAGIVSFDPDSDFEGTAILPYTVKDDDGNESLAADISVTVGGATPVATTESITATADSIATVDLSDKVTDANNDIDITTIDLDPSTPGNQNTVTTTDGVWSVDALGTLSFDPNPEFEGTTTIPYTVKDDDGNESSAADITVTVGGATPVATTESAAVTADSIATFDLTDNVTDANNDIDITTIDLDPSTPGNQNTVTTAEGVWTVDTLGTASFNPHPDFEGTATIPFTVKDDDGNESPAATISVTVDGATPVATAESATVVADNIATIDLSDNVTDANNDIDITTIDLDPSTPGNQNSVITADGVWSVDAAGIVKFDPNPDFEGTATLSFSVEDDDGNESLPANIAVTVAGAVPVATADSTNVANNTIASIDLLDNIFDANEDILLTSIDLDPTTPSQQVELTTTDGAWSVSATGIVTFTPEPSFEGVASISYTVKDDDGNQSNTAPISIIVAGAIPVIISNNESVTTDTNAIIDLRDSISDPNNDIVLNSIDLDPTTAGNQSVLETADGVWTVNDAGIVTFNPKSSFEGVASIQVNVEDDDAQESNVAELSVMVAGASPQTVDITANVPADNNLYVDLTNYVSDGNSDIVLTSIDLDPSTPGVQSTLTTTGGVWSVDPSGVLTLNPNPSFEGTASIDYVVSDDDGNVSNGANVMVTVAGAAPFADADSVSTQQGINVTIDLLAGDTDANGDLEPSTLDLDPALPGLQDSLSVTGEGIYTIVGGTVEFNPLITFTGVSSITYTVSDSSGNLSNEANVKVVVNVSADTDGDGIPDHADLDDDNDGIPDLIEGTEDSDGDGVIDSLDLDSDNDGIPDAQEAGGTDTNGDGVIDGFTDTDLDGLDDSTASSPLPVNDFDQDGRPDYVDVDSDNDGLTDAIEAGDLDANSDGTIDGFIDTDGNGLNDASEATPLPVPDTDGDGWPDYRDVDSDNDGIPDLIEAGGIDSNGDGQVDGFTDIDGDGLADSRLSSPLTIVDNDGDGIPDYLQPLVDVPTDSTAQETLLPIDSDGDGISDAIEGNGDTDGDGVPDYLDLDSDNDGLLDIQEAELKNNEPTDSDGDGIPNYLDRDSDNDGLTDVLEAGGDDEDGDGIVDNFSDSNGDGHDDGAAFAPFADPDSDADGIKDRLDIDSDNDGLPDVLESLGFTADMDGDGRLDATFETQADGLSNGASINAILDTDGDGIPNQLDLDSDGDGTLDIVEAGGDDLNADGRVDAWADSDFDGVPDRVDIDFVTGADADGDGIADFADADFIQSEDTDGDGIIDNFDDDRVGSGFVPFQSGEPLLSSALPDSNANGVPDLLDSAEITSGTIYTGLAGSGCTIATRSEVNGSSAKVTGKDPLLALLSLLALISIARQRSYKR